MNDAEVRLKVNLDDSSASKSVDTLSQKADKVSKKFSNAGTKLTVGLTVPIVGFGVAAVKSAMDLEATEAKYNTVFEGMTDDADAFIKEFQKLTPATKAESRSMASGIQDLLVPLGFAREEATKLTGDTMHLVGALTNFNSATHSTEDVANAFSSALTGQMMPLKSLGINLSATEVAERALIMTGKEHTDELTKQDKALALMDLAYANSTDALAAYNEESLDTKTKLELATKGFQDQMAVLGTQLIPIVTELVGWITKLTSWFASLDEGQQKNLLMILGIVAAIGPMLLILSKLILIVKGVAAAFTFLAANPIILVIAAIIIALILLVKHFDKVKAVGLAVAKGIGNSFIAMANGILGVINGLIKGFLAPFNAIIKGLNKLPGVKIPLVNIAIPSIPKLATGTNFFPKDGLAYLHKGESVVPRKYNPAANPNTMVGGAGNVFNIAKIEVREDRDITRVAEELFYLQQKAVI